MASGGEPGKEWHSCNDNIKLGQYKNQCDECGAIYTHDFKNGVSTRTFKGKTTAEAHSGRGLGRNLNDFFAGHREAKPEGQQ